MQSAGRELFIFEGYTLDLARGCLLGVSGEIEIRPKSFELLRFFIENAGRLISKDELIDAVWPDVIVSDDSLAQCVSELRHALNDPDRHIIKTVPRRGYLFAVPVSVRSRPSTGRAAASSLGSADQEYSGGPVAAREPTVPKEPSRVSATRRLAAILAADVVGYSRLIGADEGGTLRALKAIRAEIFDPAIAVHNGRLVKTTGDGLLVEFSSVIDALRCANQIQQRMAEQNEILPAHKRIDFRIGIHQGDVVVEDGDLFGDGVNIAVRLEGLAEAGGICVSARVREDAAGKLDLIFEDLGEQQLKNISRPVRIYCVSSGADKSSVAAGSAPPLPDRPSVAVLAFTNLSGDIEQEFLSDGIAEDIVTALSRCPWLFVIARNSSFTYKGHAIHVKQVGRELGVRYVLEGSVRKAGDRIRITAQLVEAETGAHVWAETFNRNLVEIFSVQDEISEAVSVAVAPAIADAEVRRALRKPVGSLDAWSAFQRGLWHLFKFSPDDNSLAQRFFQSSIELDPAFSGGYKGLCWALCQAAYTLRTRGLTEGLISVEALARQAVSLDGADPEARSCLALALWLHGDHEGAQAEVRKALAASPNLAYAHAIHGATLIFSGKPREGIIAIEKAIRLDPHDPMLASRLNHLAVGLYFCHEYDQSVEAAKRAIRSNPDYPLPYRWLAAGLGQLGKSEEAKEALTKASVMPSFDLYVQRMPWMRWQDHDHMVDGLRKAGWAG